MLREIEESIRRLYEGGDIQVIAGREVFRAGAKEELDRLVARRNAVRRKLGPTRALSGTVYELWLNGKAYVFAPYALWFEEFWSACSSLLSTSRRPLSKRDRLVWFLWRFRDRAEIHVGQTPHKVRGPLVECTACGYRHRYLARPRNEGGVSVCRRCRGETFRPVRDRMVTKPFGPISKAILRRRFRLSRSHLERILSVTPKS